MKFRWIILLFVLSLLGCTSGGERLFDIELEADFTIGAGLNTFDTHYFIVRRVPTRIQNFLGNTDPSLVGQILPTRAELTAPFTTIDFSIVREVSIWAVSIEDPNKRKEIFYQDRIDFDEQRELRLFSSLSEVKDIFFEERFDLEIRLNFRTFTPTEIETRLHMDFIANGTE